MRSLSCLALLLAACSASDGVGWHSYDVSGHTLTAHLPAAPDMTETIIVEGRDALVGYRITNRDVFGSVEIRSTPPSLLSPDIVHDYQTQALADGDLYSWWLPSNGMTEDRSYTVYYRRTIDGVAVTCGYDFIRPTQVEEIKHICTSIRPVTASHSEAYARAGESPTSAQTVRRARHPLPR